MYSKWTGLSILLLLGFVIAVPILASSGDPGFWMWFTPSVTPEGEAIGAIFYWILWLCAVLFVGIHAIMIYFAIVYREGEREETADTHGHLGIEVTWTIIPTILMVVFGLYTYDVYGQIVEPPEDALTVNVTAQQFAWQVEYPDQGIKMSNQMVLPSQRSIRFEINSMDVLHSFYVPSFRMKQDAVPGMTTVMSLKKIKENGQYDIKCAELCGVGHYRMNADLTVISPDQFDRWASLSSKDERANFIKKVLNDE